MGISDAISLVPYANFKPNYYLFILYSLNASYGEPFVLATHIIFGCNVCIEIINCWFIFEDVIIMVPLAMVGSCFQSTRKGFTPSGCLGSLWEDRAS